MSLPVPAWVAREFKQHETTVQKFVGDIWEALVGGNLADTLKTLYPATGNPGYIHGLLLISGAK